MTTDLRLPGNLRDALLAYIEESVCVPSWPVGHRPLGAATSLLQALANLKELPRPVKAEDDDGKAAG